MSRGNIDMYGFSWINIPIFDLRDEFEKHKYFVSCKELDSADFLGTVNSRQYPQLSFRTENELNTYLMQRAFLGLESYLPAVLAVSLQHVGNKSLELRVKLEKPFSFGAKSLVRNLYELAPNSVHANIGLETKNKKLYQKTLELYKEVRNPLFHGRQLFSFDENSMPLFYQHIDEIYQWIDDLFDNELCPTQNT